MVEPGLAAKFCAKALSSKWQAFFEVSPRQKVSSPESWHKVIFCPAWGASFHFFLQTMKAKPGSFHPLQKAAAAQSDYTCKRWCWIFCARSDFWNEKFCGGSLHKFTPMWVVDLSALAMLASITGFILRCFNARSATVQKLLEVEVDEKNMPPGIP